MSKRIKSFFISLGSIAATSFAALLLTPQWTELITWIGKTGESTLLGWGLPAVLVIVIGKLVDEIWRNLINKYVAKRSSFGSVATARRAGPDLY